MAGSTPTAAQAATIRTTREFIDRFPSDLVPFCPVGMELLHHLATTDPGLYDLLRERLFIDGDFQGMSPTPLARHVSGCELCQSCF